jgi:hypothetical protein
VTTQWKACRRFQRPRESGFCPLGKLERFLTGLSTLPAKPRAYLLLFVTGCRRGKALAMLWTEVDLKTRLMRKPKTKNGHSHLLPLPMQVIEVLSCRSFPVSISGSFLGRLGKPGRVPWHVAHFDPLTLKRGLSLLTTLPKNEAHVYPYTRAWQEITNASPRTSSLSIESFAE